ncbi:MAG: hypothetical protein OXK76_04160 [Gammaproteobacteria bacterium]|nr:hypothetical protein [Gammaproteobacteria bacterium]
MPSPNNTIEVYQDLDLTCPENGDFALPVVLRGHVRPPWRHALETEKRMASTASPDAERYIVLEREAAEGVPAARLVLYRDASTHKVANIVPTECQSLGETGYNDVLNDFVTRVAKPAQREGISFELTKRWQTMTDWTSKEAADALHLFSVMANKATGSSHPMDAHRWRDFLIADHKANGRLDSYNLRRWLVEVEDWPFEEAQDLISDREKAVELLEHYDHCN